MRWKRVEISADLENEVDCQDKDEQDDGLDPRKFYV